MRLSTLFQLCLLRVPTTQSVDKVLDRVPRDVLDALFAPLGNWGYPRNMALRLWLASNWMYFSTLPLRGCYQVVGTSPARSVRALTHCKELGLADFDLTALSHATFGRLKKLSLYCMVSNSKNLRNIDSIGLPLLVSIRIQLYAQDSVLDAGMLLDFVKTRTARRCQSLSISVYASLGPLVFAPPLADFPVQMRDNSITLMTLDVKCVLEQEMLLLRCLWTNAINTLVIRVGEGEGVEDIMFESVRRLALLSRSPSWTLSKVAQVCMLYFPRVEDVAVLCKGQCEGELPPFLHGKKLWLGDAHPFNRGDSELRLLLQ